MKAGPKNYTIGALIAVSVIAFFTNPTQPEHVSAIRVTANSVGKAYEWETAFSILLYDNYLAVLFGKTV